MLYDSYQKKILKVLDVFRKIFKHIVLISIVSALVLAAIVAFMVTKGIVLDDDSLTESFDMTYGENIPLNSKAIFSKVTYEYSSNGVEWTTEPPTALGEYTVRATAKTLFGQIKYGKTYSFALKAKDVSVEVVEREIVYGETPSVSAELAFNDKIICEGFTYGNRLSTVTTITPTKEAIKIISADGEDVTASYNVITKGTFMTIMPRLILVTVSDKEFIYNDTKLSYDGYELSEGELAKGDTLQAVFDKYLIDVGEVENTPALSVVTSDGLDVSMHYDISTVVGMLKVDYRPLVIETESAERVYDDSELFNDKYEIVGEYDVVEGHNVICKSYTSIVDVAEVENVLLLEIQNANGEDKTPNYSLFYERGTLKVTPRPVTINTQSGEWVYDNQEHYTGAPEIVGICPNQRISAETASIIDAGTVQNMVTINSITTADGREVLSNYEFIYENIGTLTVKKRPITITNESSPEKLIYDGSERIFSNYEITEGSLAQGESIELTYASFSQAGRYENANKIVDSVLYSNREYGIKTLKLLDNYDITEIYGTIDIAKRKITVQVLDNVKEYDGTESYAVEYEITSGSIPEAHTLNVICNHVGADIGEYTLEVDLEKTNVIYAGSDATKNFEITVNSGTLRVIPRNITLQVESISKIYDGKDADSAKVSVVEGSLIDGHAITSVEFILTKDESVSDSKIISKWINTIDKDKLVISDDKNADVTKNYNVNCIDGTIEIFVRKLIISSDSVIKGYDRTELRGTTVTVDPVSELNDGLLEGHTLRYNLPTVAINAGTYDNVITDLDIVDNEGNSVKAYYQITENIGFLKILPLEINVTTESSKKTYDGAELTNNKYTSDHLEVLLDGDHMTINVIGAITNAGSISNEINFTITDINGEDITTLGNYVVNCNYGTLTVLPRVIKIQPCPEVVEKIYDGTPLECIDYLDVSDDLNGEGLILDHQLVELHFESITDAGTIKICVDYENPPRIISGELDVSNNYEIVVEGDETLTVTKRKIVIVSDSAEKEYDGRPLTAPNCEWSSSSEHTLLDGHIVSLWASGIQTKEGESKNTINSKAQILDKNGDNVAHNYDITYVEGTLKVYKTVVARVTSTKGGFIYLKVKSYGDYNGQGFGPAPTTTYSFNYTNEGQRYKCSYMLWSSMTLLRSLYTTNMLTVTDATEYMLPYYMTFGGNYTMPLYDSEDYGALSEATSYTVPYYNYSYENKGTSGLSRYSPSQYRYYTQWVKDNYLSIPSDTKNALLAIVSDYNFQNLSTDNKIKEIAAFVRGSAIYDTNYNSNLDNEKDIAAVFLKGGMSGSARHFAIAATMLYRALGIPARYVEGYIVNAEANVPTDVKDAYCWVEVFVESYGWMQIEVVGSETHKIDITIKPTDITKIYDGEELVAKEAELTDTTTADVIEMFRENGYKIEAEYSGSITNVGTVDSKITNAQILDADGNNITYRFNIYREEGNLTVKPKSIDVLLSNISKTYDGKPASYGNQKFYSIKDDEFKKTGYTLTLSAHFSDPNVHSLSAKEINDNIAIYISHTVMDGEKDLSQNFYINLVTYDPERVNPDQYNIVVINPRSIEITSASQTKYYTEGAKLTNNKVSVTMGSLVEGHKLIAVANGLLEEVGYVENTIDLKNVNIADESGNDVTGNYSITVKHGILKFVE